MHVATSAGSPSLAVVSRGKLGVDNGNGNGSNRTGGVVARPIKRKVIVPSSGSLSSSEQQQQRWERGDGGVSAVEANAKSTHVVHRRSSRLAANRRKRSVLGSGGAPRAALSTTESDERATTGDAELATLELLHGQIQAPQSPILSPEASTDYIGPAGIVNEFRDSAGNEFNVVLSNEDAPENINHQLCRALDHRGVGTGRAYRAPYDEGLTKLEVRGLDRVNLLGSVCSALAQLDVSIVCGIISTGDDGVVRNTIYVRRTEPLNGAGAGAGAGVVAGRRLDEDEFASVSLQVLSACWTSDRRDWLQTRKAGKFLSTSRVNQSSGRNGSGSAELAEAEARMRAVSARLADAAERFATTRERRMDNDMLSEMEEALEAVSAARQRVSLEAGGGAAAVQSGVGGGGVAADVGEGRIDGGAEGIFASVPPFVKGVVLMNLASLLFGSNQVVIKQVVESGLDNFSQLFLRFGFAMIPLLPFVARGLQSKQRPELTSAALQLGTLLSVGYLLQIIGLDGTTSARGALTSTFTVLSVPIFAGMAGQVVPWYTWPASLMGLVGVGLLTNSGGEPVLGDAICILSATIFGYHTLQSSKYAPRFEDQELPFIALQIGVVAMEAGLFKVGEVLYEGYQGDIDFATYFATFPDMLATVPWASLAYMGFFTTSFTLFIEFLALQNVSASLAALIYTAEPLWGATFAWHFMGDRWGPVGWVGTTLIIGASVGSQLLSFNEMKKEENGGAGEEQTAVNASKNIA